MRRHRLPIDGGDEHALMTAAAQSLLSARTQKMRQARGCLRAFRLFIGKKDKQVRIAATEPCNQLPVAQNHFRIRRAREQPRRSF